MRYISRYHKVVSLDQLTDHLDEGTPGSVLAITFDDGYLDNFQNAYPILKRYGVPATIFLTTGALDTQEPIWFERLLVGLKKTTKESIELEIDVPRRLWLRTEQERLAANRTIYGLLRERPDSESRDLLERIIQQLGTGEDAMQERRNRMLTWDQVRLMKQHRIDFGGHSVTHPFLSRTTPEQKQWEVTECKRRIESELQLPVSFFAYPSGREKDIANGKEALRSAGYRGAVTTIWGTNSQSTDRLELRRSGPWEQTPEMFVSKLDWYEFVNG